MRPSSRQRVAAWLLGLPLGRGREECARRGRLEMISFWLLCWKLLRATAGLRRPAAELTDGNQGNLSASNSNPVNDTSNPVQQMDPVAMEISSSPPMTDLERENIVSWHSEEVQELHYPEDPEMQQPIKDQQEEEEAEADGEECDYLVFEIGAKEERDSDGEEMEREAQEEGDKDTGRRGDVDRQNEAERENIVDLSYTCEGKEEDGEMMGTVEADAGAEPLIPSNGPSTPSPPEQLMETRISENLKVTDQDDLGDCLQAELAVVYSDSDTGDDQWASFTACDVLHQNDGAVELSDIICDGENREEGGRREDKERDETEEQKEEEVERSCREDDFDDQMTSRTGVLMRSPSFSSTASSTDPDKRIPVDFCVQQDTLSENVSTEHVDFLLARQQWRKMEEEVRGHPIPKPGLRAQGSFQGTHSTLYPPTRSPRLKHREIHSPIPKEPPLSSTMSPSSEDSGLDDLSYRSPLEEPETAVEREIRLTLEREARHRRERGIVAQGLTIPRPSTLQTGRAPPRPPACRTPSLSVSPSPSSSSPLPRSVYHEMTANNVIILEPDCSASTSRNRMLSTAGGPLSLDTVSSANVIVVETSNLIIRSASEFCLSSAPVSIEAQESTFTSNPFFKLRSLSSQSLVEQEIRVVRQREEEWKRQREEMWRRRREDEWRRGKERYDTVLVSPSLSDAVSFNVPQRQNAMAQRWEASLLANQKKE
ncbi:hypothetical protein D4764_15G0007550 [Takifugu flavidus]|uniref:Uncharacterized protein n=1 Tax=Takifugu flavidus TaxID=433684 RepID=A0A5C6P3M7_9TELE|nr:hypothetical protein D4764_15G0007550 [Takifugu flavidus]